MSSRDLIQIGVWNQYYITIRWYFDAGNLRYWQNWRPRMRKLGGPRVAFDFLWLSLVLEKYGYKP